ncbi:MAG: hypothetical protein K8T10_04220 [Candidatus Eremiobacteraeota bacterium]|nr:hypothetical protein [Candidatus Eremiobacteraeota bacterium]
MDKISPLHTSEITLTGTKQEKKQKVEVKQENQSAQIEDRADISSSVMKKKQEVKEEKTSHANIRTDKTEQKKTTGQRVKAYYDTIDTDAEIENISKDARNKIPKADITGLSIGAALEYGLAATGPITYLHEGAHATMVNAFYENPEVTIQVDGIDNVKNMIDDPSLKNLGRVLSGYDINQDGAGGVTRYNYGDGLNERGQAIGKNGVQAIVSAAGCIAEEIPTLIGFAAGFKMRKKFPVAGYTLMAMAGLHHFATSMYPISALWTTTANKPGHDWARFAESTGIHPLLTATVFAATLPTLGFAMWHSEKKSQEKARNRLAVTMLIQDGKLPVDKLDKAFKKYGRNKKLTKAQDDLAEVLEKPYDQLTKSKKLQGELRKKLRKVNREYNKFGDFLAKKYRKQVDEKKKTLPKPPKMTISEAAKMLKEDIGRIWDEDKIGTALRAGTLAGTAGIGITAGARTVALATGASIAGPLGAVISNVIPGVSLVGTAATGWRAKNIINNPAATKMDKIAAASIAGFSALGTAGLMIPALGLPAMLISVGGILGTHAVKALVNKFT